MCKRTVRFARCPQLFFVPLLRGADTDNITVSIPNNSHNSAAAVPVAKDGAGANNQVVANAAGDATDEKEKKSGFGRKEKSVLQTKLTRLAIQIGYAGEFGDGIPGVFCLF